MILCSWCAGEKCNLSNTWNEPYSVCGVWMTRSHRWPNSPRNAIKCPLEISGHHPSRFILSVFLDVYSWMLLQKLYMLYVAPYICCCVLTLCIQMLVTRIWDSLHLFREREAERHAERFQTLINLVTAPSILQWQVANDGRDTLYCGDELGMFTILEQFSRRDSVWDCSVHRPSRLI